MTKHKDERPEIAEEAAAEKAFQKTQEKPQEPPHVKTHGETAKEADQAQTAEGKLREKNGDRQLREHQHEKPVVEVPYLLVENTGGEPTKLAVPGGVEPGARVVTVDGVSYEHCSEFDGRWVYRASAK